METLITAALTAIATSAGAKQAGKEISTAVWTDYLRPLFLKDDDEVSAKAIVAQIEAAPAEISNQQLMRSKLEEHLTGNQDAVAKLQTLLPGVTGGSQIIDNTGTIIGKQVNIQNSGDLNF